MATTNRIIARRVIAIVGTTATGKTDLGIALAQQLDAEIISADSQLIYRGLDIGTAKPTLGERQGVQHHMIDVCEPNDIYSAAMYQAEAKPILEGLWAQGKIPILVGGTGFYLQNLLQANLIPDIPPNPEFRESLLSFDAPTLHEKLAAFDPRRAGELHPNDRGRIIRALEIIEATGQPVPQPHQPADMDILWLGLHYPDRSQLDQRISLRIRQMLNNGWQAEVETLIARYGRDAHALKLALGYPELTRVSLGELSLEAAVSQIEINVRQYSRRQLTWFRRNDAIRWLDCSQLTPQRRIELALGYFQEQCQFRLNH